MNWEGNNDSGEIISDTHDVIVAIFNRRSKENKQFYWRKQDGQVESSIPEESIVQHIVYAKSGGKVREQERMGRSFGNDEWGVKDV